MVGVAQLVRAPDCESGGRGFKSRHPPHIGHVAQLDRALPSEGRGRRFDSFRDQSFKKAGPRARLFCCRGRLTGPGRLLYILPPYGHVAQLVEQMTLNHRVVGSIPTVPKV
jgi:hypothetical protein